MSNSYSEEERLLLVRLGAHIRKLRTNLNISQEKLAFSCNLDRTYIGSVERGERNISILNLKKVAVALNVSLSKLLDFSA